MNPSPVVCVDTVIELHDGKMVLIRRGIEPFKDSYALPGGHMEIGETAEEAAIRETKEETGLDVKLGEIVGVYSDPNRDPRGHTVSIVYRATPTGGEMKADTDAADVITTDDPLSFDLAFDHRQIIADALNQKQA